MKFSRERLQQSQQPSRVDIIREGLTRLYVEGPIQGDGATVYHYRSDNGIECEEQVRTDAISGIKMSEFYVGRRLIELKSILSAKDTIEATLFSIFMGVLVCLTLTGTSETEGLSISGVVAFLMQVTGVFSIYFAVHAVGHTFKAGCESEYQAVVKYIGLVWGLEARITYDSKVINFGLRHFNKILNILPPLAVITTLLTIFQSEEIYVVLIVFEVLIIINLTILSILYRLKERICLEQRVILDALIESLQEYFGINMRN